MPPTVNLWVKLYVSFWDDEETLDAGAFGRLMYLRSWTYCRKNYPTNGHIHRAALAEIADPDDTHPETTAARLVQIGLWKQTAKGWSVPAYLKHNPTAERVAMDREKQKARQRRYSPRVNTVNSTVNDGIPDGATETRDKRQELSNDSSGDAAASPASKPVKSQTRFQPPTVADVAAYCAGRGNSVDAEAFVAFYASKGWKVGNQSMKDWRQAVITWEKKDRNGGGGQPAAKRDELMDLFKGRK